MNKIIDFLTSFKVMVVAGIILAVQTGIVIAKHPFMHSFDFSWIVIALTAVPIFYWAWYYVIKFKKITASFLLSLAMTALILKHLFLPSPHNHDLFAAAEIAFLSLLGAYLEDKTIKRVKKGLHQLIKLQPEKARVLNLATNTTNEIDIKDIKIDDVVRVLQGERIPVDGVIVNGSTSIDQQVVTGESIPVNKQSGDIVYCATLNQESPIDVKVTAGYEDSSLSKLLQLLTNAEQNKSRTQKLVDKWAVMLVPVALLIAIVAFLLFFFLNNNDWQLAVSRSVTVLVVFCPCALLLGTPVAIIAAVGQASKHGIIIKSGEAMETLSKVDTMVFDKTGTLTTGELSLYEIYCENINESEAFRYIYSLEKFSAHPIAKVISNMGDKDNVSPFELDAFQSIQGKGLKANIKSEEVLCGSLKFLNENNVKITDNILAEANKQTVAGRYVIYLSIAGKAVAFMSFGDELRESVVETIKYLKKNNINLVLLSGDDERTVKTIAEKLEIDEYHAEMLPSGKYEFIQNLMKEGKKVAMFGDGINDAVALKGSDVGIAMAENGSDVAVDAAQIAICDSNLDKLAYLFKLSKLTFVTITINLTLAMIINTLGLVLALGGQLDAISGAVMHHVGSLLVIINAIYLYDKKVFKKLKSKINSVN